MIPRSQEAEISLTWAAATTVAVVGVISSSAFIKTIISFGKRVDFPNLGKTDGENAHTAIGGKMKK